MVRPSSITIESDTSLCQVFDASIQQVGELKTIAPESG